MVIVDRNTRERNRLRIKRKSRTYLAQQRANRAAQMRATRAMRKRNGMCRECECAARFGAYCGFHLEYERNRKSK